MEIACLEDEFPNVVSNDACVFNALISDVLIPCQQHPPVLPHEWKPSMISCAACKMRQMPFESDAIGLESA